MATPDHVPTGRGYDDAFNYYDGYNDQWSMRWIQHCGSAPHITNLTDFQGPRGGGPRNPAWCSQDNETGCVFQDDAFLARALDIIAAHDPSTPLFFFFSPHSVHAPLQAPAAYLARFAFVDFMPRRRMMAMVSYLDDLVGKLVTALKAKGLWDDMLFVGSSDNGGPTQTLCPPSETQGLICDAANNYPLRGGKFGNLGASRSHPRPRRARRALPLWCCAGCLRCPRALERLRIKPSPPTTFPPPPAEGGIRANAFVAGGFLPPAARGTKTAGFIAIEDCACAAARAQLLQPLFFRAQTLRHAHPPTHSPLAGYATFAGLAGVDPTDHRAAAAGLPPIDSLDMWPLLSGRNRTSPRTELVLGAVLGATDSGETFVQGVTRADGWKLLITNEGSGCIDPAWFNAPNYPNASSTKEPPLCCGDPKVKTGLGCLFQVLEDPNETVNHAVAQPTIVAALRARIAELQATTYSPKRTGSEHGNAEICAAALGKYKGYLGPFLP